MGYFSGLHLEMTLRGEIDNYEPQYQDYDPQEDQQNLLKRKPVHLLSNLEPTIGVLQDQQELNEQFKTTVYIEELCQIRDQIKIALRLLNQEITIDGLSRAKKILENLVHEEDLF